MKETNHVEDQRSVGSEHADEGRALGTSTPDPASFHLAASAGCVASLQGEGARDSAGRVTPAAQAIRALLKKIPYYRTVDVPRVLDPDGGGVRHGWVRWDDLYQFYEDVAALLQEAEAKKETT